MTNQPHVLERSAERRARPTTRIIPLDQLLTAPVRHKTPVLGADGAWALKLKDCVDAAAHELHVAVHAAKPLEAYPASSPNDMLFELETDQGRLHVTRTRTGAHYFKWVV